jgi:hypothetical protein
LFCQKSTKSQKHKNSDRPPKNSQRHADRPAYLDPRRNERQRQRQTGMRMSIEQWFIHSEFIVEYSICKPVLFGRNGVQPNDSESRSLIVGFQFLTGRKETTACPTYTADQKQLAPPAFRTLQGGSSRPAQTVFRLHSTRTTSSATTRDWQCSH